MAQTNTYGLDFLRREHTLAEDGQPNIPGSDAVLAPRDTLASVASGWEVDDDDNLAAAVADKSNTEKQFIVLHFLKAHRSSGFLAPSVIYERTGVDLQEAVEVAEMLHHNLKIRVEMIPDPENPSLMIETYAYQAKYNNVRDRATLLAQINRCKNGVPVRDLEDAYDGVEVDLSALVTAGDVVAVANSEDKDRILFPRGEAFLVELDGIVQIPQIFLKNSTHPLANKAEDVYWFDVDVDPQTQIRRGEAVQVGGQWFRVSSAVKDGPLNDQPTRAQAPFSVVSLSDLSKRNEVDGYIRPFSDSNLPIDGRLPDESVKNLKEAKKARLLLQKVAHGRSGVASQLVSSYAHGSNPTHLAQSFGTAATTSRKRPNKANSANQHNKQDMEQAQKAASNPQMYLYSHARRHGCTKDVREMYLATRPLAPEADSDLHRALVKQKLVDASEQLRRPRLKKKNNVDNDGKPKKRRYYERKNQRMTNTHLIGTEIGAILQRASEKQKQGEQVGDGGM